MRTVKASLKSISPYSQSRFYEVPKLERELPAEYEERTWMERLHVNKDGNVYIPPMALKNCLSDAAKYMGIQIPGKGKSNYKKHFEAGLIVTSPIILPIKKEDVNGEWLFLPSNGNRGDGKRVKKCMPLIAEWSGEATFYIVDEIITLDVFRRHLEAAGSFIGLGRFRPRNNGFYGRFEVLSVKEV